MTCLPFLLPYPTNRAPPPFTLKVVRRELCSVLSRGTRTYCFLDPVCNAPNGAPSSFSPIMAITERLLPSSPGSNSTSNLNQEEESDEGGEDVGEVIPNGELEQQIPPAPICVYGVCIIDSTTGMFMLGQFEVMRIDHKQITMTTQFLHPISTIAFFFQTSIWPGHIFS